MVRRFSKRRSKHVLNSIHKSCKLHLCAVSSNRLVIGGGGKGIVFVEVIICRAYGFYPPFLWYVLSIETRIVSFGNFFSSRKLIKSVVSLRYDFCDVAIG